MSDLLDPIRRPFIEDPVPESLIDSYKLLSEIVYFGRGDKLEGGHSKKHPQTDYWFGDIALFEFKCEVDRALRAIGQNVQRWSRAREGSRRARPEGRRRGNLAGPGGQGHRAREVGA